MNVRRTSGSGGVVIKRCRCDRPVLSVYRGVVSAIGRATIEKVEANGNVIGRCECGERVAWIRVKPSRSVSVATG